MGFFDVARNYLDPQDEYDQLEEGTARKRPRPFLLSGNPEDERKVIEQTSPELQGYGPRFLHGLTHDLGDLGTALASPIHYGARELYRTVRDPEAQAQKYGDVLKGIAADPYGTVERVGGAIAEGFVEPYRKREGEGLSDVVARNVLDRPLGTLMDLSAAIGIPAGAAESLGVKGAKVFADAAASLDPLTLAKKAATGTLRTRAPDAIARMEAGSAIADLAAQQATKAQFEHQQFAERAHAVFADLEPHEKALFFPYVEGRLKAMTMADGVPVPGVHELDQTGQWTLRGVDPTTLEKLATARDRYMPILDDFEARMGYQPEQFAAAQVEKMQKYLTEQGEDALAPHNKQLTIDHYNQSLQEAQAAQRARRTLSTRTALDAQKTREFNAKVEQLKLDQGAEAANDYASRYPVKPTTPEEALQVMGPQGGVYFPHSGEVFTHDQVTFGNVLTKVRESVPFKQNTGALFRSGALEQMDPEKALLRTYMAMRGGVGRAEILDHIGQQFGEKLEAGYKFGTDPDFRAGTHQLLRPGVLHQEGALNEHLQDLVSTLMRHSDDPAVAAMNVDDFVKQAASKIDQTYPLRADAPVYKIRKGTADAIAAFTKSFEPSTNPLVQMLDTTGDPFNYITLNMRPARILNNVVGNTLFQVLQGVHPFSSTGIGAISDLVSAVAYKAGLSGSERGRQLAQVFDLPGVATGGLSSELGGYEARTAKFLKEHPIASMMGGKQLAAYGAKMQQLNEHVETTARALSTLFELRKQTPGLLARMASSAKTTMDLGEQLTHLKSLGSDALADVNYSAALKNVNRFLNDYGRTTATERTMLRRFFPYHKFYKHSLELALRTPFEQPAKTALLRSLGKAAQQDFHDTLTAWGFDPSSMVPPWMQSSVPVDITDDGDGRGPHVKMLNLQGPSPFSLLSAASQGDPGQEGLAALHPAVKAAIEVALGVNLFTMQPFEGPATTFGNKGVDPLTGLVNESNIRPGPISQFAKQFFPVQLVRDLVAQGRQPYDSASLKDMIAAIVGEHEGTAFKTNERGEAVRRPRSNPFSRLFVSVPQTLEAPTEKQLRGQKATITEQFRDLGRARPDLQPLLRERLRAAAAERRRKQAEEGKPYRVALRRE